MAGNCAVPHSKPFELVCESKAIVPGLAYTCGRVVSQEQSLDGVITFTSLAT